MKKLIFLLLLIATTSTLSAKGKLTPPRFDGEVEDLFNAWADSQIVHPEVLQNPNGSGVVAVDFTLKASGEIADIEILHATHPEIHEEVIRVVKASAELWTPAEMDKVKVDHKIAATIKYPMIKEVDRTMLRPAPLHSDVPQEVRTTPKTTYRADKMPQFTGETSTLVFYNWIMARITARKKAKLGVYGRVILRFTITSEGEIDDIEVMVSPDYILSKSAISIISDSPKWTPGKQGKEKVNVRLSIPVDYTAPEPTVEETVNEILAE
ncbi:MAG: energy transducer TonB [Rikenellaceae bacterium]